MIPVIAARPDGLGTRLLTILFARQFADRLGAELSISWPSLDDHNYGESTHLLKADQLNEIFDKSGIFLDRKDIDVVDDNSWNGKRVLHLHGMFEALQGKTPAEVVELCSDFDVLIYDLPFRVSFKDSDRTAEAARIKVLWQNFNFARDVRMAFSRLAEQTPRGDGVAVHVRRGDVVNMITRNDLEQLKTCGATQIFQRYVPFDTVANIVRQRFSEAPSLTVCSEDEEIFERFRNLFPSKMIISSLGFFPKDGNKSALLDLMLLSNAKNLVTPFKSFFSECAVTVGRCKEFNAGLDIPNLIKEITNIIDKYDCVDKEKRKAIFYALGYKNLHYLPDDPYRADLLALAKSVDPHTAWELVGNDLN